MVQFTIRTMQKDLDALTVKIPPSTLPITSRPPAITQPPATPKPPKPVKIISKDKESKALLEAGWTFYKNKSYLGALEQFEKALILPTSWWTKLKIKRAIKTCKKKITWSEKKQQKEEKARQEAEKKAKKEAEEKAIREVEEMAKREVEKMARQKTEEKTRREAEKIEKRKAEKKAKLEEMKQQADLLKQGKFLYKKQTYVEALLKFEKALILPTSWWTKLKIKRAIKICKKKIAWSEKKQQKEEKARQEAEKKARQKVEEKAKRLAEEQARKEAEERTKQEIEEKTRRKAEERARQEAEERARQEAEERARQEAEEKARQEAEEKAKREAEEQVRRAAEEKTKKETEEKAKRITEEQAKKEAEEKMRKETEERKKREIEEKAQLEEMKRQAETARQENEEQAKREIKEKIRREAEEKKKIEAEKILQPIPWPAEIPKPPIKIPREPMEILLPLPPRIKPSKAPLPQIIVLVLIVLILLSATIYWLSYRKIQPIQPPPPPPPPTQIELIPPTPYFSVESTEIISIKKEQEATLVDILEKIAEKEQQPGSFKRILIKQTNEKQKYLSLSELFKILGIYSPGNFLENAGDDYMVFLYSQKEISSNPFNAGFGRARLGLIAKITDPKKIEEITNPAWQSHMIEALFPLFFNIPPPAETEKFQENIYKTFSIRYLHSPDKYLSFNFTIVDNNFLLTTSQEATYAVIDRLLK